MCCPLDHIDGDFRRQCLKAARLGVDEWSRYGRGVPHQPAGMLPSELHLLTAICREQRVDLVIESGRKFGYSTEAFCQWPHLWDVWSCDYKDHGRDSELSHKHPHLRLTTGDGMNIIPPWLSSSPRDARVFILCDGPKGVLAYRMLESLQRHLVFFAIHDVLENSDLYGMTRELPRMSTRDEAWVDEFGWLDQEMVEASVYCSRHEMTAAGFGLAIFPGDEWDELCTV